VALDRVDELAVFAILSLHMDGDDRVQRGNEEKHGKEQPEDNARDNYDQIENGGERLAVEEKSKRRQEGGKDVDHRSLLRKQCVLWDP
jgi:hypothetical protein